MRWYRYFADMDDGKWLQQFCGSYLFTNCSAWNCSRVRIAQAHYPLGERPFILHTFFRMLELRFIKSSKKWFFCDFVRTKRDPNSETRGIGDNQLFGLVAPSFELVLFIFQFDNYERCHSNRKRSSSSRTLQVGLNHAKTEFFGCAFPRLLLHQWPRRVAYGFFTLWSGGGMLVCMRVAVEKWRKYLWDLGLKTTFVPPLFQDG